MPEARDCIHVRAVGSLAAGALARCGGVTRPVPAFPDAPYRLADGELVWIGSQGAMHPRAVFADYWQGDDLPVTAGLTSWQAPARRAPPRRPLSATMASALVWCAAKRPASGFSPLLWGGMPMFPMQARVSEAHAMAHAITNDTPVEFVEAAERLIGVGHGLTPSGDDFVGAALFGLHHWHRDDGAWQDAASTLCSIARERTHAISATLFADLAAGASFAPLHALLDALGAGMTPDAALEDLVSIGHSSGWDMLAGIVAAAGGSFPTPAA